MDQSQMEALVDQPEILNSDPYGEGWMVKIRPTSTPEGLLDADAYAKHVEEIKH